MLSTLVVDHRFMWEADVIKRLGESIRDRRRTKGWTLKELAAASSLSVPYLSDLERREGINPSLEALTAVATALGCTVGNLIGDQAAPALSPPPSLDRFVRSDEFRHEVEVLAGQTQTPAAEVHERLVRFLAAAPRRSTGDLVPADWRRLLDVFRIIADER